MVRAAESVPIRAIEVAGYRIPTSKQPESDGTLEWTSTGLVTVHVDAGDARGFGYGYIHTAGAQLIRDTLVPAVLGRDAFAVPEAWDAMRVATRNVGHPGLVMSAIGAVDVALWDLKARLLDVSVGALLGPRRDGIPLYASGGFTSYSIAELRDQLGGWAAAGFLAVKMKVGREPERDGERVRAARQAIGDHVDLFVDANGALDAPTAIDFAHRFAEHGVRWFEEPVSSEDRPGLRRIRASAPAGMRIAAGEYGSSAFYFRHFCQDEAADVLMPDVTRCGGFTGFLRCAEVCAAFGVPISAHTAPQLDAHVCPAAPGCMHAEWFHDHARIDAMLMDGCVEPVDGILRADPTRPGLGLALKATDAEEYRIT